MSRLLDALTVAETWRKRNQRVTIPEGEVRLNLGAGLATAPGWINIDASPNALFSKLPSRLLRVTYRFSGSKTWYAQGDYCRLLSSHHFVHHNLVYGIPFPDDSVDFVYSSHFIEHLPQEDGERVLEEAHRVLKPEGIIRVCVPDLGYVFELYRKGAKEEALTYFFEDPGAGFRARHHYMYDFGMLAALLSKLGYEDIVKREYRQGELPDVDLLDTRPNESLHVEARKPSSRKP